MARIKNSSLRKVSRKKMFKRAKGFFQARGTTFRQTKQAVMKAKSYAFAGRKQRKRHFRQLWIIRIGAALNTHGMKYNRFIHGLKVAGIELDRKTLADLAVHDSEAFAAVVQKAQAALA